MATGIKKRQIFESEQDFLDFGRAYLSEAFPNPERKGCPPDEMLRLLASRPMQSEPSITDHMTCCSPCFNAYMAHLAHAQAELVQSKKTRRATRIRHSLATAGVVVMLMTAVYLFFNTRHNEQNVASRAPEPVGKPATPAQSPTTTMYVPVLVDLRNASPVRGLDRGEIHPSAQVISSSPLIDLTLQLPLGSEEREYSIRLSSKRNVVWSDSAQAHLEDRQMLLHMHADFSHVPSGNYDLVVVSKGFRLGVPVLVKSTSSGRMQ